MRVVPPRRSTGPGPSATFALGLAALLLVAGAPAFAQDKPVRLVPPRISEPLQARPAVPTPSGETARPEAEDALPEIVISRPPPLDVDSIGVIDEARGALPPKLWADSRRATIDRLLALLPVPNLSPASRALAERALASAGTPPAAGAEAPAARFVAVRAERLMAMGSADLAVALARAVPRREEDPVLARVLLDAALAADDNAGACNLVRRHIAKLDSLYWQKALIFCQTVAGEHDRAQLGLTMMRERRADDDPAFARLVHALGGDSRSTAELPAKPTPLHLAMLRAARQPIPAGIVETADPMALRMVAVSPNASAETRLAAASRAEAAGVLTTEQLIQVLDAVGFTAEESANLFGVAEKAQVPRAHAAIQRVAKAQTNGLARAEALARGWRIARARGFYPAAARTTLPLLAELSPAPELAWFAADAGRALLLAGRRDDARRWYQLARDEAAANGRTERSEVLLWPLLRLAGADVPPPDPDGLAAWRTAQEKLDAKAMPARLAMLTALLEALGDGTDGSLSALLLSGDLAPQAAPLPHPALWLGRDGAASAGRLGETVLFVLASLGPEGPRAWTPHTQIALIQALRAVGREADARALALEAAVAAGI